MISKYFNPFTDFGFKKLFGEEASKDLLIDFLNQLLPSQHQIASVHFKNPEMLGEHEFERKAIFDLYCESATGERFIVEMQKAKMRYFKDRSLFYATFPIRERNQKGGAWNFKLLPVYFIAILDFIYDEQEEAQKFRRDVALRDQDGELFYDKLHFKFLQMPLFNKQEHELETHFDKWVYFLKHLEDLEHIPAILNEPIFRHGFEIAELAHLNSDQYDDYLKSVLQYNEAQALLETALEDGMKQGMEQGKREASEAIAKALKAQHIPLAVIAASTGLSEQAIERL